MNWIEKMIAEQCPNGVKNVKLNTLLDYEQPSPYIVKSTEYSDEYETPVLTAGASFCLGYTNETDGIYKADEENPVIIFDDFTTSFHWVEFDFKVKSSAMKMLRPKKNNVSFRYIYFCMSCIDYVPAEHSRQWIGRYSNFEIPLPPLSIQEEIVSVLDKFSELIEKTDEEIALRQKQYEYYREKLLTFEKGECEKSILKEISQFVSVGIATSATHAYTDKGIIMFRNQNIKENKLDDSDLIYITEEYESKFINKRLRENDILVTRTGYPGIACVVPKIYENCQTFTTLIVRLKKQESLFAKYICYFINSKYGKKFVEQNKVGAAQANIGATELAKMPILIPSLKKLKSIVETLDKFETLISKLKEERELRQKQYEYYREKLLTF